MLNRIRKLISDHREMTGIILVGIGICWMMGVAGTDDYSVVAKHIYTPFLPLVIKAALGLLVTGSGVAVLNHGGDRNESSL